MNNCRFRGALSVKIIKGGRGPAYIHFKQVRRAAECASQPKNMERVSEGIAGLKGTVARDGFFLTLHPI